MPFTTLAEVIAAIVLFVVVALALAWAVHHTRRIGVARLGKPETTRLRRRAF